MILAIETSCDETAVSLISSSKSLSLERMILAEEVYSQIGEHQSYGGVVPEIASRSHLVKLPYLVSELLDHADNANKIRGIAVTAGPGLRGSLLVGTSFAKAMACTLKVPIYAVNHIEGHILSAFESLAVTDIPGLLPSLSLVVSGGHTLLVLVQDIGSYKILANTSDDAAGEAFDKIASQLGFDYPGGARLAQSASKGQKDTFKLPISLQSDKEKFSFSGLKTAALRLIENQKKLYEVRATSELPEQLVHDIAAAVELSIIGTLDTKLSLWLKQLDQIKVRSLSLCGGVAANSSLKSSIQVIADTYGLPFYSPSLKHCGDNAAMIGYVPILRSKSGLFNSSPLDFETLARWPIDKLIDEIKDVPPEEP